MVAGTPRVSRRAPERGVVAAVLLGILIAGSGSIHVSAEVRTTVSIDAYNSLTITGNDSTASSFARGEIDFESVGGGDVRSRLQLRALIPDPQDSTATEISIPRAEVRWRMVVGESYRVRFTAGRSRLTWGDGVLFNAADTINGARPGKADLTADVLRDETQWLVAGYLPLGRFAFLEPVVLVPPAAPAWHTAAGSRLQFKMGQIKTEVAYLYRGDEEIHQPSLALQGNVGVDWYLGLSLRLPDHPSEELFASGGLFYQGNNRRIGGWSVRFESLWEQRGEGFHIYPELTWSPSQLFSLFLRHESKIVENAELVTVDDTASTTTLGLGWTPTTGFTLSLYATASTNTPLPDDDTSGTVTAAVSYVF